VPQETPVETFISAWIGQYGQNQGTSEGSCSSGSVAITGVNNNLFPTTVYITPLCQQVEPFIKQLRLKIRNRQPLTDDEARLMASMPAPVLHLINLASIEPGIEEAIFSNMTTYITAELASTLLQSALAGQARFVGACTSDNVGEDFKKLCMEQSKRISELSRQISQVRLNYYKKFAENIDGVLKAIQLRKAVMTNLASTSIGGSLIFSQLLGGLR
ncbi:MAG: conjugal transfer protein TraH, partial [Aquificaceae bacterium]